ncbi:MAG: ABC transporter ATP-binding protein [Burkholderiales bacterium]|nr:ABC transporter ATP-binding protein [Burkholderiales bacterium]
MKHGFPTASVVRSSQATPARRRGKPCTAVQHLTTPIFLSKPVEPLLLDEPLSNLDAKLRESMRFELKDVQRRLQVTVVYVTHDQAEAMVMSDRIVVMDKGVMQQVDVPRAIYDSPANRFVADFIGLINFLESTTLTVQGEEAEVELKEVPGAVRLTVRAPAGLQPGDPATLAVRPEAISLAAAPFEDAIPGRLVRKIFHGNEIEYRIALGQVEVRATTAATSDDLAEGDPTWVSFRRLVVMTL